jgi:hypothetical protein
VGLESAGGLVRRIAGREVPAPITSGQLIYTRDAEADRAFLRDVLGWSHVDAPVIRRRVSRRTS